MIVVGAGRVGTALHARALEHDLPCTLVSRESGLGALEGPQGDPVLLAVRNADLEPLLASVPGHRRSDLVFVQNGQFRQLLRDTGVSMATRGLLYFAVPTRGAPVTPGQVSWFCGPHGLSVARWLGSMGLTSEAVDWARFSFFELEKLSWLVVHGLLCTVHDCTVGAVADAHTEELGALVAELAQVGRVGMGVGVPVDYLAQRIVAYSRSVPTWRATIKEWPWRNGWFVDMSRRHGIEMPVHERLVREAGHGDKLDAR